MRKFFLVLIFCGLFMSGCQGTQKSEYYENGLKSMKEGNYESAIAEFDMSIAEEARLAECYRGAGISYLEMGDYPQAIAAFSRSLNSMEETNKEFKKDVMYYLASAREDYGEIDKAIEVYTDILKTGKDVQSFFLRGKLYLSKKDYENAKDDFSKVLEKSKDYNLYINIFKVYDEQNMTAEGNEYLEKALEFDPKEASDYYDRGRIYYYMKDYDGAKGELTAAIKKGDKDAILLLGKVYLAMEDVASARSMYQDYLSDEKGSAKAYNGMALCDIHEKNYDNALDNIQKGLEYKDEEETQSLLFNEIVAYEYKLDFETATLKMSAYLEMYPDDEAAIRENEFLQSR